MHGSTLHASAGPRMTRPVASRRPEKVVLQRTIPGVPAHDRGCCTVGIARIGRPARSRRPAREPMTSDDTTPRISEMHDAATAALDAAGVRWCRLRPTRGAELDLLAPAGSNADLDGALATAGFATIRRPGRGTHRAYHAVEAQDGTWAKVDVVTRIDLGPFQEVRTDLAAGFLERATAGALEPDDAFWAVLLHELWDRPAPAIRRTEEIRSLAADARADGPAAAIIRPMLPSRMDSAWVIERARAGDDASLVRLGRRMRARARPTVRLRRIAARVVRWLDRLDPPFLRRGVSVALLGPDGTGKSMLSGRLAGGGPIPVRTVYLGLYGGHRDGRDARRIPGLGFARRLLRMWRGWVVGRMHVARGRIVIFDRHPIEARSTLGVQRRPPIGRRLLARSIPAPDTIVVLDAPAAVLYARKPEHPVDRLEAQRAAYLALATRLPRATVVDVDRPADAVVHEITALVWSRIARRAAPR